MSKLLQLVEYKKSHLCRLANGFTAEIIKNDSLDTNETVNVYLQYGNASSLFTVMKSIYNVPMDSIEKTIDQLYAYTELLISNGYNTGEKILALPRLKIQYSDIKDFLTSDITEH